MAVYAVPAVSKNSVQHSSVAFLAGRCDPDVDGRLGGVWVMEAHQHALRLGWFRCGQAGMRQSAAPYFTLMQCLFDKTIVESTQTTIYEETTIYEVEETILCSCFVTNGRLCQVSETNGNAKIK